MLTCLAIGLGSLISNAQSSTPAAGNQINDEPRWLTGLGLGEGIVINADNDNNRVDESIRFSIGKYNDGKNFTSEFTRGGMNLFGLGNKTFYDIKSTRGLDFLVNAGVENSEFAYQFRVQEKGIEQMIVEMSYKNGLAVRRVANFFGHAYFNEIADFKKHVKFNEGVEFDDNILVNSRINSGGPMIMRAGLQPASKTLGHFVFRDGANTEIARLQNGNLSLNNGGIISGSDITLWAGRFAGESKAVIIRSDENRIETKIQDGIITTDQVKLNVTTFPDYVFAEDYKLMPLKEVAQYIKANKHLPHMPTEAQVIAEGMNVGQINTILVEKVEELTLHTINQEEKIEQLMKKIEALEAVISK
ncbi:hypothetical protein [Aquimarina rhabdastrellae]